MRNNLSLYWNYDQPIPPFTNSELFWIVMLTIGVLAGIISTIRSYKRSLKTNLDGPPFFKEGEFFMFCSGALTLAGFIALMIGLVPRFNQWLNSL